MGKTIFQEWQSFEREIVPGNAPPVQREECRRAFYAGVVVLRRLIFEAVDAPDSAGALERLDRELDAFPKDLRIT